jgi:acetyl esterase
MAHRIAPTVEPATRRFLEELNAREGRPLHELAPAEARQIFRDLQARRVESPPVEIADHMVPGGPDGQGVPIRVVRPAGSTERLPAIVYLHGGGWVLGDTFTHDRLVRELASGCGVAVVFVSYTLAPEARYPVQIEQAYAAACWVSGHGAMLGIDATRMIVAGDGVGGNMATVMAMVARERGGPALLQQVLFYPVTDAHFDTASYRELATGHHLERDRMRWFWDQYLPELDRRSDPHASPLCAPLDELALLPPALVLVAEHDVLRDEGEAYAHRLARAGVEVAAVRFLGTIHDFAMLNAIRGTSAPRAAIRLVCETVRRVFGEHPRPVVPTLTEEEEPSPTLH